MKPHKMFCLDYTVPGVIFTYAQHSFLNIILTASSKCNVKLHYRE